MKISIMKEERVYAEIKSMLEKDELLPKSLAIWQRGFQDSEYYLLRKNLIEKVWINEVLFYKFN